MDDTRNFLNGMSQDGWVGLEVDHDRLSADMKRIAEEAVREAMPIAQVFGTPEGQQVLYWLMAKTILRPPTAEENEIKTAEEFAMLKKQKDGQNGVIFMILHALQVAHGNKPGEA